MKLEQGGQTDPLPGPDAMLAEVLRATSAEGFVVFEDWMAKRNDSFLVDPGIPSVFYGQDVYHLFSVQDAGLHPGWRRACANYSPLFHKFVFEGLQPSVFDPVELIKNCKLKMLIFWVFDGESHLIADLNSAE